MPLPNSCGINFRTALIPNAAEQLAIYVHWPYCARICPYCDFNVYKRKEDLTLLPAILRDLEYWREMSGPRRVTSIHFGGGTPSLMTPTQVSAVIEKVAELWGLNTVEIALEANPHEANASDWDGYRQAGLNRLSLGVQSFNDEALKFLGRDHDGAQAQMALDLAVKIFPSVSADLIFGWAGQSKHLLADDLSRILGAGTPHVSAYQLTIEDGTAFAKAEGRGQIKSVNNDLSADLYDQARDRFMTAGFEHYEVSNFAKPGHRSQHNLAYWRAQDYVGVGPGAHGRLRVQDEKFATIAHMRPGAYVKAVQESGSGQDILESLPRDAQAEEYVMMGLRIDEGISLSHYAKLTGQPLSPDEISNLCEDGLLRTDGDNLSATASGRQVLNAVTERLLLG